MSHPSPFTGETSKVSSGRVSSIDVTECEDILLDEVAEEEEDEEESPTEKKKTTSTAKKASAPKKATNSKTKGKGKAL